MDYLTLLCLQILTVLTRLIPLQACLFIGQCMGRLFAYSPFFHYHSILKSNWYFAFQQKLTRKQQIAYWGHFGANLLAGLKISTLTLNQKKQNIRILNVHFLTEPLKKSRGVVMATAHLSCWELLGQIPQLIPEIQFNTLYQPLKNRYADAWVRKLRAQCGVGLINRRNAWKEACEKLRNKQVVAVFADQHAGKHGIWLPLFQKLASTSPLPALLAKRTHAVIVPCAVRTEPNGKWLVEFFPPIEPVDQSIEELTLAYNQWLETVVSHAPKDWLWGHQRWKTPNPRCLLAQGTEKVYVPEQTSLKPFRVLVRGMNWLGDAVMHLAALRNLKMSRPDLHLTILTPTKLSDLYKSCEWVDEIIETSSNRNVFQTAKKLRSQSFDLAVIFPNSWRALLEVWLGGIRRRCGFRVNGRSKCAINHKIPLSCIAQSHEHQSLTWLRAMHWLGAELNLIPFQFSYNHSKLSDGYGIIAPGAEYGPAKRWLPDRFAETAQKLSSIKRWILVGGEKDKETCQQVASYLPNCEDISGTTSLADLIPLLKQARIVLGNDSGIMHLAGCCNVPTIAIFGSTDPSATRSLASQVAVVRHHLPCSPCFHRTCPLEHLNCLKHITVNDVIKVAESLLANHKNVPQFGLAWESHHDLLVG